MIINTHVCVYLHAMISMSVSVCTLCTGNDNRRMLTWITLNMLLTANVNVITFIWVCSEVMIFLFHFFFYCGEEGGEGEAVLRVRDYGWM